MCADSMHVYPVGVNYPVLLVFTLKKVFRLRALKRILREGDRKLETYDVVYLMRLLRIRVAKYVACMARDREVHTEYLSGSLISIGNTGVVAYRGFSFKYFDFPVLSFHLPSTLCSLDTDSASDHKERLRGGFGTDGRVIFK